MNQLQNLLHDALIATEHVQNCAIIRRKDASIKANSVNFNVCILGTKKVLASTDTTRTSLLMPYIALQSIKTL